MRSIRLGVAIVCCLGCTGQRGCSTSAPPDSPISGEPILTPVDEDHDPCSDFASYACGSGYPVGRLEKETKRVRCGRRAGVHDLLERLVDGSYQDGKQTTALLADFYVRCTDRKARDLGMGEVREQVAAISRIKTLPELARTLGALRKGGIVRELFDLVPTWEAVATSAPYVASVGLNEPALPREAYAGDGHLLAELRKHWQVLAASVGGIDTSEVEGALRVDRWLASREVPDLPDPLLDATAGRQPLASRTRLEKARFPWGAYLAGLGLSLATPIRPGYADALAQIDAIARLPVADLRSYLKMMTVERSAEYVGLPSLEEELRFHHHVVGEEELEPFDLPVACADLVSRDHRPWIDEAYLASVPAAAEAPPLELFQLLRDGFGRTVAGATWLDDATRRTAAAKVNRVALRFVGDPEPELDGAVMPPGSLWAAIVGVEAHKEARSLAQIGTVGERKLQLTYYYDAAYAPLVNSVWLSPEYARAPWIEGAPFTAATFGALGTVMGHELAHALSIGGRRFDAAGIKHETWPTEAVAAFESRTSCLEKHLATFDVGAKWKVDGHRTLDEDLAELVGLRIALAAMDAAAGPTDAAVRDERRRTFFIAHAQQLCGAHANQRRTGDEVHPPVGRILSGTLANIPEFAEAFRCAPGTRMAPRERCAIW